MKKLIIIITMIIVANITCFGPTICNAEIGGAAPLPEIKKSTGPSLEETLKWVTEKIASIARDAPISTKGMKRSRPVVSFNECEMKIVVNEGSFYERAPDDVIMSIFNLQDIDENKFGSPWDGLGLFFYSLGSAKVINLSERNRTSLESYALLPLPDIEVVERMENAMKHAIVLCRQKSVKENVAQPAKKKELF